MADIKTILDKVKSIGSTAPGTHKDGTNKKKTALAAGSVGFVVGMMIGYSRKWNLFYSIAGGTVLFGVIGYLAAPED